MDFGLALAGGGTRGAAHVGVLLALEEEHLFPRSIAGTSAGSIVAGLYASGVTAKKLKELVYYLAENGLSYLDPDILGILRLIPCLITGRKTFLSGLFKGNKLLRFLEEQSRGKYLEDLSMLTVIPAVDLNSGFTVAYTNAKNPKPVPSVKWEYRLPLSHAMMASSSFPAVFQPRRIQNYYLIDGGVTSILPVELLIRAGENHVLAVDIGECYEMLEKNNLIEVSSHAISILSAALKSCSLKGECLTLRPDLPKQAGLLTFEHMVDCMHAGYQNTKAQIPQIKKALMV